MGEIKRYDSYGYDGLSGLMKEHADGDWVRSEEYDALRAENLGMVAQRMAYAGEFPPDQDGLPDTGSIHQNIRKLRAENAELVAALKRVVSVAFSGRESSAASMCNIASNALAKHRGE